MVSGLGIGWSVTSSPTAPAALILMIKVPWDQTNVKHAALLRLVDADGHDVRLGESEPIHIKLEFETGRPPGITHGTPIDMAQAINIGPLPIPPGHYEWLLEIDGQLRGRRPFVVKNADTV